MPVITELLARLGVDSRDFDGKLREAQGKLKKHSGTVASIGKDLKNKLGAIVAGLGVREIIRTVDSYTVLQNRLRAVTDSQEELVRVQERLFKVSRDTRSSVEANVELFSRLALSSRELGVSESELINFTQSLNQAIKLSGATATEAQAGLIQLSQGMASGALRGDELRSVLEQLPAVADVIAKSLGVTRGQLREMGSQGQITAEVILKAFREARGELADRFGSTLPTIAEGFQQIRNEAIRLAGELSKTTGFDSFGDVLVAFAAKVRGTAAVLRILREEGLQGLSESAEEAAKRVRATQAAESFRLETILRRRATSGQPRPDIATSGAEVGQPLGRLEVDDGILAIADSLIEKGMTLGHVWGEMAQIIGSDLSESLRFTEEVATGVSGRVSDTFGTFFQDITEKQTAFSEQANEAWSSWLAQATSVTANVKLAVLDFFQSFSAGFGDALAQVIVFQADFAETMKSFLKNLLAQVISTLTQIVVQWVIATIAQAVIGTAGHIQRVGQALQLVYLNAFAATAAIPIIGPVLAPGVAAASTAAAAGGSIAAAATGGGVGSAGSLALGLDTGGLIASEGLAFLHAGEVVATPDEVKDAMTGDRGGFTFNLLLDGRLVARSILPHIPREIRMRGV
jgi:tape measure domain-containing protein